MEETIVLLDAGFLSKLSKYFGNGQYVRYDLIKFSEKIAKNQNLFCKHIFYYTAPPFQCEKPTKEEIKRKENYDKFVKKLLKNKNISVREGRCQRLKIGGKFIYKQKAVDTLLVIDLMKIPLYYKNINKIILIASDSDFVPVVKQLEKSNIKTILYTYYQKGRTARFSTSNELIKSVYRYVLLTKQDFENVELNKSKKDNEN